MSDRQEFYAATVEEALEKASNALGVARGELDFEVLDRGSSGFLGIGMRDARIAVGFAESQADVSATSSDPIPDDEPRLLDTSVEEPAMSFEERPEVTQEEDARTIDSEVPHDLILAVDEFMTALLDVMGFDATVDAYDSGDVIVVDVATKETGLFIGQKGETIDAIQYLLNVAVYKLRPFVKRIVVDSEGYRQRRVEAIKGMAHRTARRAIREERSLSLPPMPAAERRVVHLFLKENPKVMTFSDGEDENRRVIVSPA